MHIIRLNPKTVSLMSVEPFYCQLLHLIGHCSQSDDPLVQSRFFTSPSAGLEPELDDDWQQYVLPDLRQIFQSALEVVEADLETLQSMDAVPDLMRIEIPLTHLDAWIHSLNQARLALSARYCFDAQAIDEPFPGGNDQRAIALLQVHIYGMLMEWFLHELDTD